MVLAKRYHKVAVLMGGPSGEREVSLNSGRAVAGGLADAGYDVTAIDVPGRAFELPPGTEAVFIALHGAFGEDGQVQAMLDARQMPYTGSGAQASRDAMDKISTKRILKAADIATPPYAVANGEAQCPLPLPVILKPAGQGSSLGIERVVEAEQWGPALEKSAGFGDPVLVEQFVKGIELTVGIVDDRVLPIIEIVAPEGNYDYRAKYTRGMTQYRVPAPISADLAERCRVMALDTYRALGCRGFGRVDFRVDDNNQAYVLELNSIPGFTETSLLPKAAACVGISFADLCDQIMSLAEYG